VPVPVEQLSYEVQRLYLHVPEQVAGVVHTPEQQKPIVHAPDADEQLSYELQALVLHVSTQLAGGGEVPFMSLIISCWVRAFLYIFISSSVPFR